MKTNKFFLLSAAVLTMALVMNSCKEYRNQPGDNDYNLPDREIGEWADDSTGLNVPAGAITVKEALAICAELQSGKSSSSSYYIKGLVQSASTHSGKTYADGADLYLVDKVTDQPKFLAYLVKNVGNKAFTSDEQIVDMRGNWVVVSAKLYNYYGTPETSSGGYIYSKTNHPVVTEGDGTLENPYTMADMLKIKDNGFTSEIYVKGVIVGAVNQTATSSTVSSDKLEFTAPTTLKTNILIAENADVQEQASVIVVKLAANTELRNQVNLKENPDNLHQEVIVKGTFTNGNSSFYSNMMSLDASMVKIGENEYTK